MSEQTKKVNRKKFIIMLSALLAIVVGVFVLSFIICNFSDKANKRKKHIVSHLAQ